MPNHVSNLIRLHGDRKRIEELRMDIAKGMTDGGEKCISFNNIVPRDEYLEKWFNAPRASHVEYAEVTKILQEKYKCESGYEWCTTNWGTKWDAYEQVNYDFDSFGFDTAWSHPFPIITKLSEMYPDITIEVTYADEDMGSNAGKYQIQNGEETTLMADSEEDMYDIYFEVNGDDPHQLLESIEWRVEEKEFDDDLVQYILRKLDYFNTYESLMKEYPNHEETLNGLHDHYIVKIKLKLFLSDEEEKEG